MALFCCGYCPAGGRYVVHEDGLEILNATNSDAGNYTCRAEVSEVGEYSERFISVAVNSASPPAFTYYHSSFWPYFAYLTYFWWTEAAVQLPCLLYCLLFNRRRIYIYNTIQYGTNTIQLYDYFNLLWEADMNQLSLPHAAKEIWKQNENEKGN